VNGTWDGVGHTRVAIPSGIVRGRAENVLERKAALLATLSEKQINDRLRFLKLLTDWMPQ
jgi:hypothetical protein